MGQAGVMASVGLGLGLAPGAVAACVIMQPICHNDDGIAELSAWRDNVVLFRESRDSDPRHRTVLVECNSREGVLIVADEDRAGRFWIAEDLLYEIMMDDAPQTLTEVATQVRAIGVEASRVRLGAGHCGCDLPATPPPPNYCE
ncbi:hypothetical protein [Roseicyclus sp.]|uniref:hypothetical protein n=1 Tax=Roseicyclus sp. TaxID=1914329 RepID=UPI003FA09191